MSIALALMEPDGLLPWRGYLASSGSRCYLVLIADVVVVRGLRVHARTLEWLRP